MRNIQVISTNHQTHNSEERIGLDLNGDNWEQLFAFMKYNLGVEGHAILRTCNRIEIYFEASDDCSAQIIAKWLSMADVDAESAEARFQIFNGFEASIEHLLHLSVGFKSTIFGDDQIISQLKKAFEEARKDKSMSTLLERAYQSIMRFHKQVCRETDFRSHTVSLAYQALKSAKFHFGLENLMDKDLLIIGAGDMAAQVVKYLPKFKFNSVSITNRTQSKAEQLAQNKAIKVIPYQGLDTDKYDFIISCTDQGFELIDNWSSVDYYIDLSLHSAHLPDINGSHILLHELQEVINEQNKARMQCVDKVHLFLVEKINEYVDWCIEWRKRSVTLYLTV